MTNDFKQRIVNYQQNGDRLVIDEILYGATLDFANDPTRKVMQLSATEVRVDIKLARPEYYVGYRVRRLKNNAMRALIGEKLGPEEKELNRILSMVYMDFGVKFTAEIMDFDGYIIKFKQDGKLIEAIDAKMDEIKANVYAAELPYFMEYYGRARRIILAREQDRQQVEQGVHANVIAAIEHGLKYVDTTKSEREIIVYLNKAITSKFGELELRRNGLKRIYRINTIGDKVPLFVKRKFPADLHNAIMPELSAKSVEKLTKKQAQTVLELLEIIRRDRLRGDKTSYSCDRRGNLVIKRDYAARELGLDYENLRKTLSRIRKKVTK